MPSLNANDSNERVRLARGLSTNSRTQWRSMFGRSPLVSITCAISFSGASSSRSIAIASPTVVSLPRELVRHETGWRRRVSEKRCTSSVSDAVRNRTRTSFPKLRSVEIMLGTSPSEASLRASMATATSL